MTLSPEQLSAANKAVVDSMLSLAATALDSAERVAALNLNTVRSVLEDSVTSAKAFINVKDPQEALSLQASMAQPNVEKAVAYTRSIYEISDQAKESIARQAAANFADWQKQSSSLMEQISKSSPVGSDVAVAALKSAMSAANSAFDSLNKAAKQFSEIAEANVAAATNATVKTVGATAAAASPSKKK
ncbi:MAG: phasin family protein [Zoogloeaceae bacterium]|nr:phasin family protein [Zoogloeaceae bacterium]